MIEIEVLRENPWYLVVNKPSGVLTQAVPGIDSLQTLLVLHLQSPEPAAPIPFVGIPHRLDRVTSGAMVVARNQRALRRLSEQFAARTVQKIYHAIVPRMANLGSETAASESANSMVSWVDSMRKVPDQARAELAPSSVDGAKEAILRFRVVCDLAVDGYGAASLVEIVLETGRMHQIRLQFGSRGYAILGDSLYGSTATWLGMTPGERESSIALHARQIEFRDPKNAENVSVVAPYPSGWPIE